MAAVARPGVRVFLYVFVALVLITTSDSGPPAETQAGL